MKKLRAQQIVIDLPSEMGEAWVNSLLQTIVKDADYQTIQQVDRSHQTHRKMTDIQSQIETINDPVTGQDITLSAAGAAVMIKAFMQTWMKEDHGGYVNEHNDLIIEE